MRVLEGIGKIDRQRIASVLRGTKGTVSVQETANILAVSSRNAAKMLSRWAKKGWMSRVRQGLYVPVPLESESPDVSLENPWLVALQLYSPCYIGGWSAAEYFDLTEQMFSTIMVMTVRKPRDRQPIYRNQSFLIRTVPESAMFGLKPVWQGQVKIMVSDPARTLGDMLIHPACGGGIRMVKEMLARLIETRPEMLEKLLDYGKRLGNGGLFKRLGFLLEVLDLGDEAVLADCQRQLTAGNAKLDPALENPRLVTRWRLWVPENWKEMANHD